MFLSDQEKYIPKSILIVTGFTWISGVMITVYLILFSDVKVHHDCAYFLQSAQLLLRGAVPYVDFSGINPPLANYLHVVPVLVAYILKINIPLSFYLIVTSITVMSSILVYMILLRSDTFYLWMSKAMVSITVVLVSLTILSWGHYGQREHLFILGYIPFIFLREARYRGKSFPVALTIVVGLLMSLFALLKPHFVFVAVVADLWLLIRTRRWKCIIKPEVLVAAGLCLAYLFHFLLVPKSMFHAFFHRWLPLVRSHYDVYNTSRFKALYFFPVLKTWVIFIGSILAIGFIEIKKSRNKMLVENIFLAMLAGYGIHVFQHKGFQNHIFPSVAFFIMFCVIVMLILMEDPKLFLRKKRSFEYAVRLLVVLFLLGFIHFKYFQYTKRTFYLGDHYYPYMPKYLDIITRYSESGDTVAFISTTETPVYPTLLYANRFLGTRYVTAAALVMSYEGIEKNRDGSFPYRIKPDWSKEERQYLEELGEDILTNRPKLVFVNIAEQCNACPDGFHLYEYLVQSGWWDTYFKEYTFLTSIEEFDVYLHDS